MTVNDVYSETATVLMEDLPTGLSLGIVTSNQFLAYFADVFFDFLQSTGMIKKLINIPVTGGTGQYTEPYNAMVAQEVFYGDRYIYPEDALNLDSLIRGWRSSNGSPRGWHEDRLALKTIELVPSPANDGMTVTYTGQLLGTISSTSGAVDFNIIAASSWFGTISSYRSPIYVEYASAMFGTIGSLVSSTGNVDLLATTKGTASEFALTDLIQFIPDSFVMYIKYGILNKIFSSDSEAKDLLRARYAGARFAEGISLGKAMMQEQEVS